MSAKAACDLNNKEGANMPFFIHNKENMTARQKLPDFTGMKFGRLTVIAQDGNIGRNRAWECLCECGNIKRVLGRNLNSGDTKSCGCLRRETYKNGIICHPKIAVCVVCDTEFSYSASTKAKFCCKECGNKFRAEKGRNKYYSSIEDRITRLLCSTRSRCIKLGLLCDIDSKYVLGLLEKQNGRCAKTGIKFEATESQGIGRNSTPWAPSIDQIIPSNGYTKDNIQLVCVMYNFCKHTWDESEILVFAKAVLETKSSLGMIIPKL